jgi:hypothetical protein
VGEGFRVRAEYTKELIVQNLNFNLDFKILAFYGGAIAAVIILFKSITVYGENYLHPPAPLKNRYLLTLDQIPNCKQINPVLLKVQQSGIYVNAALLPTTESADKFKQLSLSGLLNKQELNLSGKIDAKILCQNSTRLENHLAPATLRVSFANEKKIIGQLFFPQVTSGPINFTGVPQH